MEREILSHLRGLMKAPYAGSGANEESLTRLIAELRIQLPADYLAFMRETNGYTGEVGDQGFVNIWPIEEVLPTNMANSFLECIPGVVLFASNAGGEFFAFDFRSGKTKS